MAELDLKSALEIFKQGMQSLGTARAIQGATEQVQQIRQSEQKEFEQRQAIQGVANDLALRLAAFGTPATTIQATSSALVPPLFTPEQIIQRGVQEGRQEDVKAGQEILRAIQTPKIEAQERELAVRERIAVQRAEAQAEAATRAQIKTQTSAVQTQLDTFDRQVKKSREAINDIDDSFAVLNADFKGKKDDKDAKVPANRANFTVKKMLNSVEGGRITKEDVETAMPALDIVTRAVASLESILLGQANATTIEEIKAVSEATKQINRDRLTKRAETFGSTRGAQLAKLGAVASKEDFIKILMENISDVAPQAGRAQLLQQAGDGGGGGLPTPTPSGPGAALPPTAPAGPGAALPPTAPAGLGNLGVTFKRRR